MTAAPELPLLVAAGLAYAAALAAAWTRGGARRTVLALVAGGLAVHTLALALRWARLGHGPFTTMHEILASNVWSLGLAYALALATLRWLAPTARYVLPLLVAMAAWMLVADAAPGHFPPTYATPLLYVHTAFGKVFLGLLLVATGLAAARLAQAVGGRRAVAPGLPDARSADAAQARFASAALVAQSAMLVAGAVWAQDAWGRYWAWDPLESWAFASWGLLAIALHARLAGRPRPLRDAALVLAAFAVAFLTFFGVPFVSTAPHQGAI